MEPEIVRMAKALENYVIERRRYFHMYPELRYEEYRTSEVVASELKSLGYEIRRAAGTGVIGILRCGDGPVVALRADMDALPIQEENDVPYRSRVPGKMHACGHDAHTAMLLGAARILASIKSSLKGTIKLIFQPAEEGGLGAKKIVEEGHLNDVEAIFGIHVWSDLPTGYVGIKEGPLLAAADTFTVKIKGKGGHGAAPHQAIDPIVAAADIINAYQKIVSREVSHLSPVIISVTQVTAGTTFNVIPQEAVMKGTIRTLDENTRDYVLRRMKEVTEAYARAMRCTGEFTVGPEYVPATVNDPELADFAREVIKSVGIAKLVEVKPMMVSEDFSFYTTKAKGLFLVLGVRSEEKGITYPHHHPRFDVDESALYIGTAMYALLAYKYLLSH